MPAATTTLPADASSVRAARRWVEELLSEWGHPELGWTAASVISELATNCHLHARTSFTLAVRRVDEDDFLLEISDGSPVLPRQRRYGLDSTTGRGLALVDRLSDGWGVVRHDDRPGKTVWVKLSGSSRDTADDEGETDVDALLAGFSDDVDVVPLRRPGGSSTALLRRAA